MTISKDAADHSDSRLPLGSKYDWLIVLANLIKCLPDGCYWWPPSAVACCWLARFCLRRLSSYRRCLASEWDAIWLPNLQRAFTRRQPSHRLPSSGQWYFCKSRLPSINMSSFEVESLTVSGQNASTLRISPKPTHVPLPFRYTNLRGCSNKSLQSTSEYQVKFCFNF